MAWIDEIDVGDAGGRLDAASAGSTKGRGRGYGILRAQSLNPEALGNHLEREAIGVVVSATNECGYCVREHRENLGHYLDDEETLEMLGSADGLETLEPRLSNIVRHAEKLTSAPSAMTESDLGELRAVGLSDRDILDVTLVVAYFNLVNRVVLGLGVTPADDETQG
jgi:uncharacterized peroxidase-related enzyme